MQLLRNIYQSIAFVTGVAVTLMLTACCDYESEAYEQAEGNNYINLTFYVSGSETVTRGLPQGGEDGDGREAGFLRENKVEGITLILYKSSQVDFVKYYEVNEVDHLEGRDPQGTTYNYGAAYTFRSEARYTTGDRRVETGELDFKATYYALIVANKDLSTTYPIGTPVSTVLEAIETGPVILGTTDDPAAEYNPVKPWQAARFMMSTERTATINFGDIPPTLKKAENRLVYNITEPMLIERMSARIDFCTAGGIYNADRLGYEYLVNGSTDRFVVTKITPFNLYNSGEYLFKRVTTGWPSGSITYLGDETTTNFVVDPRTSTKESATPSYYLSQMADLRSTTSPVTQNLAEVRTTSAFTDAEGYNNIIVAYPKENTLKPNTNLMKYATGIAIEGDYYVNNTGTPSRYIYYTYMRHQGENATGHYDATRWNLLDPNATAGDLPMNFGVVRNNIYQVSINSVSPQDIDILLKVKMWDPYLHAYIYM